MAPDQIIFHFILFAARVVISVWEIILMSEISCLSPLVGFPAVLGVVLGIFKTISINLTELPRAARRWRDRIIIAWGIIMIFNLMITLNCIHLLIILDTCISSLFLL
jgi:hypothetical protein